MKVLNCMSSFISLPAIIQRILQVCVWAAFFQLYVFWSDPSGFCLSSSVKLLHRCSFLSHNHASTKCWLSSQPQTINSQLIFIPYMCSFYSYIQPLFCVVRLWNKIVYFDVCSAGSSLWERKAGRNPEPYFGHARHFQLWAGNVADIMWQIMVYDPPLPLKYTGCGFGAAPLWNDGGADVNASIEFGMRTTDLLIVFTTLQFSDPHI